MDVSVIGELVPVNRAFTPCVAGPPAAATTAGDALAAITEVDPPI